MSEVTLRPLREDDLKACVEVFYLATEELRSRAGETPWPRNEPSMLELFGRLVASHRSGAWIAEADGRAVAFVIAVERERCWFLDFLFVLPGHQSAGLGRRLLDRSLPAGGAQAWVAAGGWLATVVESTQPISTALYASYGLLPRTPLYLLTGTPRAGALPGLPRVVVAAPIDEVERRGDGLLGSSLDAFDLAAVGYRRAGDHAADRAGGRLGVLYLDRSTGHAAGFGYVQQSGRIGPAYAGDPELLAAIVGDLMTRVQPAGGWQVIVPGPAPALPVLLRAGFRLDGAPAIFCATAPVLAAESYLPRNFALP